MDKLNTNRKIKYVAIFEGQNIGWLAYKSIDKREVIYQQSLSL